MVARKFLIIHVASIISLGQHWIDLSGVKATTNMKIKSEWEQVPW